MRYGGAVVRWQGDAASGAEARSKVIKDIKSDIQRT
jgi:hypothetical protein